MDVVVLGAKSALAVLLVVAAGAKLADLPGFAAAVRLFVPRRVTWPVLRAAALGVALAEFALGAASLSSPAAGWLNPVVMAVGGAFVVVSVLGYAFHRGRSCRCFGALTRRKFDAAGIARGVLFAAVAAVAIAPVEASSVRLTAADRLLLLAAAALLAFAAFTAAGVLAVSRAAQPVPPQPVPGQPTAAQPTAAQPTAAQPTADLPAAPQLTVPQPRLASP